MVAVVAVVVAAALVDAVAYHGKVHAGVSVAGVDLSGQTAAEAAASLRALVEQAQAQSITVKAAGQNWTLSAEDAGTAMDVDGAVRAAMAVARAGNVFADIGVRWGLWFGHRQVPLAGSVDEAKLDAFVADVAAELDVAPVDAGLVIKDGGIETVDGVDGKAVDRAALAAGLKARLVGLRTGVVEVPVVIKKPGVTAEDNAQARLQAETMISGPVTVAAGDDSWTVSAATIASAMSFRSEDQGGVSTLVPFLDATKLQPLLDEIAPNVLAKPEDARFAQNDTRAWVVPGKNGRRLDAEATAAAITAATLVRVGRMVKVVTKEQEPDLTTAEAKAMGISAKLSSCTTTYTCPAARQTNVKLATKYGTGVFLAPGEGYDFDKQIGSRKDTSRGWQPAPGITGPNELEDVLGGGICQVSTTMFNAVAGYGAGLKITERWPHSLFIKHYPLGRDATVTEGGKNLRFRNDMDHYVWITGTSTGVTTTIIVWGTDQGRSTKWTVSAPYNVVAMAKTTVTDPSLKAGKTSLVQAGQDGMCIKTTRVVTENGKTVHKDVWINKWLMYPQKTAVGTGTTTTKPPTTSTTKPRSEHHHLDDCDRSAVDLGSICGGGTVQSGSAPRGRRTPLRLRRTHARRLSRGG